MPRARSAEKPASQANAFCDAVFTARPPALRVAPRPGTRDEEAVRAEAKAHGPKGRAVGDEARNRVLSGLALLWHDQWDAAHDCAQAQEGEADHDLLHAMAHRREGDHGNAGYWFDQAGTHPSYLILAERLSVLPIPPDLRAQLLPEGVWSPTAFNNEVRKRAREESPATETLMMIQAEEFRALAWSLFVPRAP